MGRLALYLDDAEDGYKELRLEGQNIETDLAEALVPVLIAVTKTEPTLTKAVQGGVDVQLEIKLDGTTAESLARKTYEAYQLVASELSTVDVRFTKRPY